MKPVRILSALLLLTLSLMVSALAVGTETGVRENYDVRLTEKSSTEVTVSLTDHTGSGTVSMTSRSRYVREAYEFGKSL